MVSRPVERSYAGPPTALRSPSTPRIDRRRALAWCAGAAAWALIALLSAMQGQIFANYQGRPQDWWPSLGYSLAIFSVWAALTPGVLKAAERVAATGRSRPAKVSIWIIGLPGVTALHLLLFVLIYGPIYGGGAPPQAIAKPVLLANLDTTAFAYAALSAVACFRARAASREQNFADSRSSAPRSDDGLWIRSSGAAHLVAYQEIDWIAAAGDYAEVHTGGRSLLTDRSLAALEELLPHGEFARIHRSAIVRLDRVREVRRLGRGDASVLLHTGRAVRLSRRYRGNLVEHLPI